jgi:hypothetical protein
MTFEIEKQICEVIEALLLYSAVDKEEELRLRDEVAAWATLRAREEREFAEENEPATLMKLKNAQEERRAKWGAEDGIPILKREGAGEYAVEYALEEGLDVELAEAGIDTGMSQEERLALEDSETSPFMRKPRAEEARDVEVAEAGVDESENSASSSSPPFYTTPFYMLIEFGIDPDELPKGIDLDTMVYIAIETLDRKMPPSFVFEQLNVTYGDVDDFDSDGLLLSPGEGEHTFQLGPVQL